MNIRLQYTAIILFLAAGVSSALAKAPVVAPSYAWTMLPPLGLHETATIDTLLIDYSQKFIPSAFSSAYATTGNYGSEGINMIYFDRKKSSDFFFHDALNHYLPEKGNHKFYNTRIPMTLVDYSTGGGREATQDRLTADFSGNVNAKLQFGANVDYIYSKGSYANQAVKNLTWGLSSSYMGDRFEYQTYYNHFNSINQESGGITDDLWITDPAVLQGGTTTVDPKTIPTNLSDAFTRLTGQEFLFNGRYKVGYWHTEKASHKTESDTIDVRTYIPVSSFIWTLNFNQGRHRFKHNPSNDENSFWENTYLSNNKTDDNTSYWSLKNTFGISLLEGFHKYAKFGLAAYVIHEMRRYNQTPDSISFSADRPETLSPYPYESILDAKLSENLMWAGGQLTKQRGSILRYDASAHFGVTGRAIGEVHASGNVSTRFKLFGDTVSIAGYGSIDNECAPLLLEQYVSNHFIWKNEFDKIRRVRFGGKLDLPFSGTKLNVGAENIQNMVYFNESCLPTQHSGSVQVFSATLEQKMKMGILNWNNRVTYQTSSNESVLPLPKLAVYSNLFIYFKVAQVLSVQLGVNCDYYTKYYAPGYQPATMSFYNQREMKLGNYPFMNAYANMKLDKARFFVLFSHVNQGMTGRDYFSIPHYPLNPRRFQIGVSVDFSN